MPSRSPCSEQHGCLLYPYATRKTEGGCYGGEDGNYHVEQLAPNLFVVFFTHKLDGFKELMISGKDHNGLGFVGGIAGITETGCTITGCYNTGEVSGTQRMGGILGYSEATATVTMTACYNTGTVSSHDSNSVGNMIGTNEGTANILKCCWATGV